MQATATSDSSDPRIIVALDFPVPADALEMAGRLNPALCRVKVGKELFVRGGPDVVRALHVQGHQVFLDLKFHDIPNTVAGACSAAVDLGIWMINVHASGGTRMMAAARAAVDRGGSETLLIAVTVLTSLSAQDLDEVGLGGEPAAVVGKWAAMSEAAGMDGVVCSPADLEAVSSMVTQDFLRVTPGVRPAGSDSGDQRRVATPEQAIADGASYLVIGRPVTGASSATAALEQIAADIKAL